MLSVAGSDFDSIVVPGGEDRVVSRAAAECVDAIVIDQQIAAVTAIERVVSEGGCDCIAAILAEDEISSLREGLCPRAAERSVNRFRSR
jgi:hypothetical protein